MHVLLVFNPFAAHRRARKWLPDIEAELKRHGVSYDLAVTAHPGHAVELVRGADFAAFDGVVAAGGDGTLFEVVNGYFQNASPRRIPIGVLPIGTGNAFARDLQLTSSRWREAVEIIARGRPRCVDVGRFVCNGQTYHYLNIIGLGFVADVTEWALRFKGLGNIAYTLGVLVQTLRLRSIHLRISLDGRTIERDCIFAEVSNTRYTSNFFIAPAAEIDDGLLDVILLNDISRFGLLRAFPKVFSGQHVHHPHVEVYQARQVEIAAESPKILSPDGELVGVTPVVIECVPGAAEVFWK